MNHDLVDFLTALALIGACAGFAISTAAPPRKRTDPDLLEPALPQPGELLHVPGLSGGAGTFEAAVAAIAVTDRVRPRIFTGEPAPPEPGQPVTLRALKLVGGLTALAAVGAIALLAFVRAMVAVFQRIGG